ncbi:hypothetical protein [Rhizobium leguminosarum]
MFVQLPDGGNLLIRGYSRAVAGDRRPIDVSATDAPEKDTTHSEPLDIPDGLGVLVSIVLILTVSWFLYGTVVWFLDWMFKGYAARSPWIYFVAAFSAFIIARVAYHVREIRRVWWEYPPLEIGVGLGLAAVAVRPDLHPVVNVLTFLGAVRIITDGIKRFADFRKEVEKRREHQP